MMHFALSGSLLLTIHVQQSDGVKLFLSRYGVHEHGNSSVRLQSAQWLADLCHPVGHLIYHAS